MIDHAQDSEIIRHSPCCKEGCGRKSIMRIRRYFEGDDEGLYVGACEDHAEKLIEIFGKMQDGD
jgi:hypothetical protein